MPGTLHSTRNTFEIAERRASVRVLVTPPIYINLDNLNGGLVFNISEDGLALTAALDLTIGSFLSMRILLPDSQGWMEAGGEIAWRGKSKKEGGVRFVGLAQDARQRIGNWIAAEASHEEFQVKKDPSAGFVGLVEDTHQGMEKWNASEMLCAGFQVEKKTGVQRSGQKENTVQRLRNRIFSEALRREFGLAADELPKNEKRIADMDIESVRPFSRSILKFTNALSISEKEAQRAIAPRNSDPRPDEIKMVAQSNPRLTSVMPEESPDATGALEVTERRVQARTAIIPPVYVNLENTNGGLAFNMSEDGIALTAALAMAGDGAIAMRIPIPDSKGWMEASGRLAWRSASGKTAGITFLGLPDDSRQRIRQWLAAETSGSEPRPEEGMLAKSEKRALDDVPAEPPMVSVPELLKANSVVEKRILEAILSEHRLASMDVRAKVPVSRERPERELEEQTVKLPDGPAEQQELLENPKLEIFPSGKAPSVGAVQQGWQALVPSEIAVPGGDELPPTADAFRALRRRFSTSSEFKPKPRPSFDRITSGTRIGKLRRVAAVVVFAGATGAGIGWVAARRSIRNEVTTSVVLNTEGASQPAKLKTSHPLNETIKDRVPRPEIIGSRSHDFEPLPSHGLATDSETRSAPLGPQIHGIERPAASPVVNGPARHTANSVLKTLQAKLPERAVVASQNPSVEDARSQVVEGSPVQPTGNAASQATIPSANLASGAAVGEVKERESPPPLLEHPAAAAATIWSVAVSPDPYPSIRMSQDINSQKPSSTRSLEIGRVISRVEPDYPEDAKNQGIEGTVKLHVVVGHDGSVQSVEPISGQVLLLKAAMSAVREWHYAQTLLGGQPVETEQDIVVKFQRESPSISKN